MKAYTRAVLVGLFFASMAWGQAEDPRQQALALIKSIENHPSVVVVEGGKGGVPRHLSDVRDGRWRYNPRRGLVQVEKPQQVTLTNEDRHVVSFYKVDWLIVRNLTITADRSQEALKFSACRNVLVENVVLEGGPEDALDIVRGKNYVFRNVHFIGRGDQAVTIKGSVDGVYFLNCTFSGRTGKGALVEFGNWSDYDIIDRPPTRNIYFDADCTFDIPTRPLRRTSLRSVTHVPQYAGIRTLYAERPVTAGPVPIEVLPSFAVDAFFSVRRRQTRERNLERYTMEELRWGLDDAKP